jgi:hypothetical protein
MPQRDAHPRAPGVDAGITEASIRNLVHALQLGLALHGGEVLTGSPAGARGTVP